MHGAVDGTIRNTQGPAGAREDSVTTAGRDEVTLQELIAILWRGKWVIIATTIVFAVAAGVIASVLPKKYTATVTVSPVSNKSGRSDKMGSLASSLGGFAAMAGITLGADNDKAETIAVLQSDVLTQQYIEDNDLLPVLFEKKWDAANRKWRTDPEDTPTLWKANEFFDKRVRSVVEDRKSGMVTLKIVWTDPELAARWANGMIKVTNDYLRNKAIVESERHIEYLSEQAQKTDIVQVRSAIYSVLESEIRNVMLARGTEEYALRVIDPAFVPERKTSPQRLQWVAAGFAGGLFLSVLGLCVRHLLRPQNRPLD